jgi:hypothetical protein
VLSARGDEVRLIAYDQGGEFHPRNWPEVEPLDKLMAAIRRQGLTALFRNRGGLLEAGPTAHFVKPSGRLDSRFLRAAHALSEGGEIFFTALWLLPCLGDDVRVVHVDTSSIASVVFAAQLLKGSAPDRTVPSLRTFRSYEGIDDHPFSRDRRELALISASQSGSMAEKLQSKLSRPTDVITLFSLGELPGGTTVLCDLRRDEKWNPRGLSPAVTVPSGLGMRAIRIIGEHFVAEAKPARAVLPIAPNAPSILRRLGSIAGAGVFSVLRAKGSEGEKAPWLDVGSLLRTQDCQKWIRTEAVSAIPLTTRALVRADDDPDTLALVGKIVCEVHQQTGAKPAWREISLAEVETGAGRDWPIDESPVLVVSGAVGHGRELLSASRALRDFAPKSRRVFLTAAVMGADGEVNRVLARNLQFGGHQLVRMLELAIDRRRSTGSWVLEREELQRFEGDLPPELVSRLATLGTTSRGLSDNLFLKDGAALELRRNFAFWEADHKKCTQADVFVTIAALLEHLRSGSTTPAEARLVNDAQTQSVIAPETFARFNDGVIQAAFLRAAHPVELNYSGSPDQSRAMADLIVRMADLHDRPQGEALCEFLLAFRLGRLVLDKERMSAVRASLQSKAVGLPPIARWLVGTM